MRPERRTLAPNAESVLNMGLYIYICMYYIYIYMYMYTYIYIYIPLNPSLIIIGPQILFVRLELDVISFNVALSACRKGSLWQSAVQLLSEMEATSSSRVLGCTLKGFRV